MHILRKKQILTVHVYSIFCRLVTNIVRLDKTGCLSGRLKTKCWMNNNTLQSFLGYTITNTKYVDIKSRRALLIDLDSR